MRSDVPPGVKPRIVRPPKPGRLIDFTGQTLGQQVVLGPVVAGQLGIDAMWRLRCGCGAVRQVQGRTLKYAPSTSCYRCQMAARTTDLTGQRFGKWLVVRRKFPSRGSAEWECLCDCGTEAVLVGTVLRQGKTTRCYSCALRARAGREVPSRRLPDDQVSYHRVHQRLVTQRGRAANYLCECGSQAQQWAYQHGDPDEQQGYGDGVNKNRVMPYTTNLMAYKPMCIPCHRRLDGVADAQ